MLYCVGVPHFIRSIRTSLSVYVTGMHSEFVHMLTIVDAILAVSVILRELTCANSLLSTSFLCKTCVMSDIPLMKINAKWHALCSWVRDEALAPEAMWLREVAAVFSGDATSTTHLILVNRETHWTAPTGGIKFKLIMNLCAFIKSWRTCLCYQFAQ